MEGKRTSSWTVGHASPSNRLPVSVSIPLSVSAVSIVELRMPRQDRSLTFPRMTGCP
jgi:hypothetical protein